MFSLKNSVMIFLFLLFSGTVNAACSLVSGTSRIYWSVNPGVIVVNGSDPIGKVLYTKRLVSAQNGKNFIACTAGESFYLRAVSSSPVPGFTDVFTTNLAGIGIRVTDALGRTWGQPGIQITPSRTTPSVINFPPLTFEIIKTGPTPEAGTLDAVTNLYAAVTPGLAENGPLGLVMGTGSIQTRNICRVNTPSVAVNLGIDIPTYRFKGVGTTTDEKPLQIGLDCDTLARVNITLDGREVSGVPGVIALNPETGVATGIGVQLLRDSTPVTYGVKTFIGTASADGHFPIDYTARYYQTGSGVTGGKANATAQFTITYE